MKIVSVAILAFGCAGLLGAADGYEDTPFLPNSKWRVHDKNRPRPPVVDPGPGPQQPFRPPSDALVLFDGTGLSEWRGNWKVENGYMEINRTGNLTTKKSFGSCQLHVEFATPVPARNSGQGRGNSGIFLMGRYEVQVLDSYQNETYADGQCAALYGQAPPLVNASRPPGEWQSYDIIFEAPVFQDGKLEKPGYITVLHNGVLVHNRTEILGASTHRALAKYSPHRPKEPISIQDHGNPVRFRNIWVRPLAPFEEAAADAGQ